MHWHEFTIGLKSLLGSRRVISLGDLLDLLNLLHLWSRGWVVNLSV